MYQVARVRNVGIAIVLRHLSRGLRDKYRYLALRSSRRILPLIGAVMIMAFLYYLHISSDIWMVGPYVDWFRCTVGGNKYILCVHRVEIIVTGLVIIP